MSEIGGNKASWREDVLEFLIPTRLSYRNKSFLFGANFKKMFFWVLSFMSRRHECHNNTMAK